jgi:ArsR family transcriptional regulator
MPAVGRRKGARGVKAYACASVWDLGGESLTSRPGATLEQHGREKTSDLDRSIYLDTLDSMSVAAPKDLTRLARVFHALSDETRLCLVAMLRDGERCVCDLTEALDSGQSRLSFHLRTLKDAGLVQDRREGRWAYYSLVPGALDGLEAAVGELSAAAAVRSVKSRCC